MKIKLYIYDLNILKNIDILMEHFECYTFYSFLDKYPDINDLEINSKNIFIDLTNVIVDDKFYYRGYIEKYILTLKNLNSDYKRISLGIQSEHLSSLLKKYPFLIEVNNILTFIGCEEKEEEIDIAKKCEKIRVTMYNDLDRLTEPVFSIPQVVSSHNGLSFSINSDIDFLECTCIDLISTIEFLKIRKDLLFNFELILLELSKNKNIKYILHEDYKEDLKILFPFTFEIIEEKTKNSDLTNKTSVSDDEEINLDKVNMNIDSVFHKIKGHNMFKKDFKFNFKKFKILNRIGEKQILSVFLCGPSGIGKTVFAETLSNIMYPGEDLIKINFGNYTSEGALNSLIGSPKGYIGSEDGGELTKKIENSNSKIILIDEFEKADEKIFHFFYELLEEGYYTDRLANIINLDGYIIIFTSNLGRETYSKFIPRPLDSRFDMKYLFEPLSIENKREYIHDISEVLIKKLNNHFNHSFEFSCFEKDLYNLLSFDNLRDMKREAENIIIDKYIT